MRESDLRFMIGNNENILWSGKPKKSCFILESIFNPMLPFALIWGIIDFTIIGRLTLVGGSNNIDRSFPVIMLGFFALHLMPVWIYLFGVILSFKKYKNTEFIITDKGIYISGGMFSYNYEMKPFTDLAHINLHRGIFDQMLGVGDVVLVCGHRSYSSSYNEQNHLGHGFSIIDIEDYQKVFKLIKELQTDIYADTMYPNDLRPEANHGYNTVYSKKDDMRF